MSLDLQLLRLINTQEPIAFIDGLMLFITKKGYAIFLLFAIWAILRSGKKALLVLILCLIALGLADGIGNLLKYLIERPRPFNVIEEIRVLTGRGRSYSFPSNHTFSSFAVATILGYFFRYLRIPAFIVAFLIGLSRIYVGVHYPTDVVGGALFGLALSILIIYSAKKIEHIFLKDKIIAIFYCLLLSLLIARLFYINYGPLELSPDEAYYWEWSRRPDLSYYSEGPLIAYLIGLTSGIGGATELGVRFFTPFSLFFSSIIIFKLSRDLYGDSRIGVLSGLLLQFVPLFSTYGVIMTIDSPFIFFWALSLFLFYRAIHYKKLYWWVLLGLSAGFGLLAKYSMAFFYICGAIFLLSNKEKRLFYKDLRPYLSVIVSAVVFIPVLVWNIKNDFVTLRHIAGPLGVYEGLRLNPRYLLEFLGSQLGVITPLLFIALTIPVIQFIVKKKVVHSDFLMSFSLPVLAFFFLKSIVAEVQANRTLMAYHTLFILFSAWLVIEWNNIKKGMKALMVSSLLLLVLIAPIIHFPRSLGLPPELDPSARLRGWKALGERITEIGEQFRTLGPFFIISDKYEVSSEIAFYTKGNPVTYYLNLSRRMNQYDLWPGFQQLIHYNAIFVTIGDSPMGDFKNRFTDCQKELLRTDERVYSIFRCLDFKGMEKKRLFERY